MLQAQENRRVISGTVKDKTTGELLPGATVLVKGTYNGAVTNIDGEFIYRVVKFDVSEAIIEVSFIGYQTKEIKLGQDSVFHIALESAANDLQEVVITSSYGTKKLKQDVVGSISSVKPQDLIVESAVTSIDQLLEGQAAGVLVETGEGIDSPSEIHIRGVGTLPSNNGVGTSTQPLIIVDGVILSEEIEIDGSFEFSSLASSEDPSNPLAKIGIKDIESINILKDAAAVSLYGANGANGVILITTKGGNVGKLRINAGIQTGISMEMDDIKYMNGEQFNDVLNLYKASKGENTDPWNGISTDWHDLLNRNASYQNYNFSISGGTNTLNYRISAQYQDTKESQIENSMQRFTSNIALGCTNNKLKIDWRLSPSMIVKKHQTHFQNLHYHQIKDHIIPMEVLAKTFQHTATP